MSRRHSTPSKAVGNRINEGAPKKDGSAPKDGSVPKVDAVPKIIVPKIGVPEVVCPEPEAKTEPVVSQMPADSVAAVNPAPAAEADTTSPAAAGEPDAEKRAPSRALALYVLAVLLLALLEAGRLQTFLEQTELPGAVQAGAVVQDAARLSGATLVANAEARLTRQLAVETVIGSIVETGRSLAALAAVTPATAAPTFVPPTPTVSTQVVPAQAVPAPAVTPEISVAAESAAKQPRHAAVPKVLIVGDSLIMEGLGPSLHRTLRKRTDITVVREGRYSTGLTRTDTFNWPDRMRELVAQHQPDIILVCLGANDSQDILVDGKRHIAGTPSWQALYRERADRFVAESTAQGATVIWLGLPIMGKPAYEKRIRLLSDLQEAACNAEPLCRFQNGMAPLADADGNYLAFVLDDKGQHVRLRYKDMIHVTEPGGQRLVDNAMPLIDRIIEEVKTGAPVTPSSSTPPVVPAVPATPGNPAIPPAAPAAPPAVPPAPSGPEPPRNDAWDALLK